MQRVAIGRALVRRPKALLMDEPIGALDAKLREQMRAEIKRLHIARNSTSVYVTHDQIEAMSLADRIVVMHAGLLQQVGAPEEVYNRPANLFVAQFVGSPVMNVSDVAVEGGAGAAVLSFGKGAGLPVAGGARRAPAGATCGQAGHPARGGASAPRAGTGVCRDGDHQHRTPRLARDRRCPTGRCDTARTGGARLYRRRAARLGRDRPRARAFLRRRIRYGAAEDCLMARIELSGITKSGGPSRALRNLDLVGRRWRVLRAFGADGGRQDHDSADDRRVGEAGQWLGLYWRQGCQRLDRRRARRGAGPAAIFALPAPDGAGKPGVPAARAGAEVDRCRDRGAGREGRKDAADHPSSGPQGRAACRAARCSGCRSGAPSCASHRSS